MPSNGAGLPPAQTTSTTATTDTTTTPATSTGTSTLAPTDDSVDLHPGAGQRRHAVGRHDDPHADEHV